MFVLWLEDFVMLFLPWFVIDVTIGYVNAVDIRLKTYKLHAVDSIAYKVVIYGVYKCSPEHIKKTHMFPSSNKMVSYYVSTLLYNRAKNLFCPKEILWPMSVKNLI